MMHIINSYHENGQVSYEVYYLDDKWHRVNGPARIWYYESGQIKHETYHLNKKCHRIDGPAIIWYYKNV